MDESEKATSYALTEQGGVPVLLLSYKLASKVKRRWHTADLAGYLARVY